VEQEWLWLFRDFWRSVLKIFGVLHILEIFWRSILDIFGASF
jgi:hypothetical protein